MDVEAHEAERLYNDVKKFCGTNSSPQVKQLEAKARKLYDNFRGVYNPRELEREATEIKEFVHGMDGGQMQPSHINDLYHGYEKLRIELRKYE